MDFPEFLTLWSLAKDPTQGYWTKICDSDRPEHSSPKAAILWLFKINNLHYKIGYISENTKHFPDVSFKVPGTFYFQTTKK